MSLMNRIRNWKPFGGTVQPHVSQKGYAPTMEGWLNTSWDPGWWQQNCQPLNFSGINGTVEACVSALSQTAAMCPAFCIQQEGNGANTRLRGSNPERVLSRPNDYETRSLFINNVIRSVYFEGNAYAVATRDDRGAVSQLHLMDPRATQAVMDPTSGEVYYYASPKQNQPFDFDDELDRVFPSRNVFHLRLYTDRDPLKGVTPLRAVSASTQANSAMLGHQATFFSRMSRPSGILSTEETLTGDQIDMLRQKFREQSAEIDSGGIPVLGGGLKFQQMGLSSQDAQLADAFGMTVQDISRAFRVPLPIINDMTGSTFNNAESLMTWFLASGLGFLLESLEQEFARLFSLPFGRKMEFDTTVLLRSDWKTRMEALGEGSSKGIYALNEARAKEGLPPVDGGDLPMIQQQMVPLNWHEMQAAKPPEPAPVPEDEDVEAALRDAFEKEKCLA